MTLALPQVSQKLVPVLLPRSWDDKLGFRSQWFLDTLS